MHYTVHMKKIRLSPTMQRCLELVQQHGKLVKYHGGNWNVAGLEQPACFDGAFSTPTILALIDRGRLQYAFKRGEQLQEVKMAFDNEERHRSYGIRRGDLVTLHFGGRTEGRGEVVAYGAGDNNQVVVQWNGADVAESEVAEWLTITTKVEDRQPGKIPTPCR